MSRGDAIRAICRHGVDVKRFLAGEAGVLETVGILGLPLTMYLIETRGMVGEV